MTEPVDLDLVPGRLELSGPAEPHILEVVHCMLGQLWTVDETISVGDRTRFEMSVIEVLGNIVEHAYAHDVRVEGDPHARRFDIRLAATDEVLVATMSDNGLPVALDLSDVAMPEDDFAETGRGLALATAALDDLQYERVDGRNRWMLLCRRRAE